MNRSFFRHLPVVAVLVLTLPSLVTVGQEGSVKLAARGPGESPSKVDGTYIEAKKEIAVAPDLHSKMPPKSPGNNKADHASIAPSGVSGKKLGAQPSAAIEDVDEEDESLAIPVGPFHPPAGSRPQTGLEPAPAPGVDPDGFEIFRHCRLKDENGLIHGGLTNEPSGAVTDSGVSGDPDCGNSGKKGTRTVFATANSFAAFSVDDGATFTKLNLANIKNFTGTLCCDQVVVFVPKINRFVWVMLVRLPTKPGALQLLSASPEEIASSKGEKWSVWEITPADLGFTSTNHHFDFPGLVVGDNSLYLNVDGFGGLIVCRFSLEEVKNGGTLHFEFTHPTDSPKATLGHLTEDPGSEVFWAQHDSNSQLRVFSWAEGTDIYRWRDVDVETWPSDPSKMVSTTPDGKNWLSRTAPGRIRGATHFKGKNSDDIWFAWTASAGDAFKQPHIHWVKLDHDKDFKVTKEGDIFNDKFGFGYPALAANSDGEIGLSLEAGGGGKDGSFENHVVGFLGDGTFHHTTHSSQGVTRFGDYVTIHRDAKNSTHFDAFGYGVGTGATTHFVRFGRPTPPPPPPASCTKPCQEADQKCEAGCATSRDSCMKQPHADPKQCVSEFKTCTTVCGNELTQCTEKCK